MAANELMACQLSKDSGQSGIGNLRQIVLELAVADGVIMSEKTNDADIPFPLKQRDGVLNRQTRYLTPFEGIL